MIFLGQRRHVTMLINQKFGPNTFYMFVWSLLVWNNKTQDINEPFGYAN